MQLHEITHCMGLHRMQWKRQELQLVPIETLTMGATTWTRVQRN